MKRDYLYAVFLTVLVNQPAVLFSQSADKNYVLTRTMLDENGNAYLDNIQYYDGLGRPTQNVQVGITPNGEDLVTMQEYDGAGREIRQWIPTPISGQGKYVTDFTSQAGSKHNDNNPYNETVYENSPLNRVVKQIGAGRLWHAGDKGVKTRYLVKTGFGNLRVSRYHVSASGRLSRDGDYASGDLFCMETKDEDGNLTYTFTDNQERTVLIRQINKGQPHDTYYVYDDFGNRCYVLPPMINDNISSDNLNKYAYQYKYDDQNRCIESKLPGCEPVYMIYDKSGRLVLSQDGNQRPQSLWTVNKYDKLGRLLYTSEVKDATELNKLRQAFSGWLVTESFSTGAQEHPMEDTGYSRGFYHVAPTTLLTVYYYDTYDFLELLPNEAKISLEYSSLLDYGTKYHSAKGMLTGTRTYLLDEGSSYIATAYYYDAQGNVIQKHSTNHIGGHDRHFYKYSFSGKLLKYWHDNADYQMNYMPEIYTYVYDRAERLSGTAHSVFGVTDYTDYVYDEVGRLKQKSFNTGNETADYSYNIRGWLTAIDGSNFKEDIIYTNSNNYNGNIAMITWRTPLDEVTHSYSFTYDGLNRLKSADYGYMNTQIGAMSKYFNVEINSYDKNGNILSLIRKGRVIPPVVQTRIVNGDDDPSANPYDIIDDLSFTYNGNQLISVEDASVNDPVYKEQCIS